MHKSLYRSCMKELRRVDKDVKGDAYLAELAYMLSLPNGREDLRLKLGAAGENKTLLRKEFEKPLENPTALMIRMQHAFWFVKRLGYCKSTKESPAGEGDSDSSGSDKKKKTRPSLTDESSQEEMQELLHHPYPCPLECPPSTFASTVQLVPDLHKDNVPPGFLPYFSGEAFTKKPSSEGESRDPVAALKSRLPQLDHEDGVNSRTPILDGAGRMVQATEKGGGILTTLEGQEGSGEAKKKQIATGIRFNAAALVIAGNGDEASQNRLWVTTRAVKSEEPINREKEDGAGESYELAQPEAVATDSASSSSSSSPPNEVEILGWTFYAMHQASGDFTQLFMGMEKEQHTQATFATSEENWQSATVIPTDLPAVVKGKIFYRLHSKPQPSDSEPAPEKSVGDSDKTAIPAEVAAEQANKKVLIAEIPPCWVAG